MSAACRLRGGRLVVASGFVVVEERENCFLRMSAYDLLAAEGMGLSRRRGSREEGGSMPGGIDFLIIGSKFLSIQA